MQKPDPLAMIKIAITNIFADGCYTAPVFIGSEKTRINVFLDTGSSSLAVNRQHYDPGTDRRMAPTNLVQEVAYEDDSGWKGAVVRTRVAVRHFREQRRLYNVPVAVADWQKDIFVNEMQGILGLAYTDLDFAYQFRRPTWPSYDHRALDRKPQVDVEPYFSQLEESGTTPNKFSLYTLRSQIHHGRKPLEKDPWNAGFLILGGGEEYRSLYRGQFRTVKVVHDLYYNTNMKSIRVGSSQPIPVPPPKRNSGLYSNSIVDSGTSTICLPNALYRKILRQFRALNPDFHTAIRRSVNYDDVKLRAKELQKWPNIHLTMEGLSKDVELRVRPQTYWQTNYTKDAVTAFAIDNQDENQTILGLPFMNNYYCVFDRSGNDGLGVIRFAAPKLPQSLR